METEIGAMIVRKTRYSIRGALVATLFAAIVIAYFTREEAIRQGLLAEIVNAGGKVEFDSSPTAVFKSKRVKSITIPAVSHVDLSRFRIFHHLSELNLMEFRIIDENGVESLTNLRVSDKDLLPCFIGSCEAPHCPVCFDSATEAGLAK